MRRLSCKSNDKLLAWQTVSMLLNLDIYSAHSAERARFISENSSSRLAVTEGVWKELTDPQRHVNSNVMQSCIQISSNFQVSVQ